MFLRNVSLNTHGPSPVTEEWSRAIDMGASQFDEDFDKHQVPRLRKSKFLILESPLLLQSSHGSALEQRRPDPVREIMYRNDIWRISL